MLQASKQITRYQVLISLFAYIIVSLVAGYGIIAMGADISGIYATLNKPYFAPPTWVFGAAWSLNGLFFVYGLLRTLNLSASITRSRLLWVDGLIVLNYMVFQYLSFGSEILFGKLLPIMFFLPTFSMLVLIIIAMKYAYKLDTSEGSFGKTLLSGRSIVASLSSLLGWLIVATALGYSIWMGN